MIKKINDLCGELGKFILRYENLFRSKTHTYSDKVTQYLRGLSQSEKSDIEKMCEKAEGSNCGIYSILSAILPGYGGCDEESCFGYGRPFQEK